MIYSAVLQNYENPLLVKSNMAYGAKNLT